MAEFHPEARVEVLEAIDWYENVQTGLGSEVLERISARVRLIEEFPGIGSVVPLRRKRATVRRFPLGRFPFLVVYLIRDAGILGLTPTLAPPHGQLIRR